jgi:DNA-directed RNA polymerase specialized sigma24 family protein
MSAPRAARFPTTRWSLVVSAGAADARVRLQALGTLLNDYLVPLRHYLVRRRRLSPHDADDLLQSFLSEKVLRDELVPRARRSRGRFRTFILSALNQFLAGHARHAGRKKRRFFGGASLASLPEPQDFSADPVEAFEVTWARGVLDLAVARMHAECGTTGRQDLWVVFDSRVLGPTLEDREPVSYEALAGALSLGSAADVYPLLTTAKRMFARNFRAVVREYTCDPGEVDEEVADLRAALARAGRAANSHAGSPGASTP